MIIHALRYRPLNHGDWRALRFMSPSHALAHVVVIGAKHREIDQVAAALDFALTGDVKPDIAEVALQLSDSAGQSWIVQRRDNKFRILKNGVAIANDDAQSLFAYAIGDGIDLPLTTKLNMISWKDAYHIMPASTKSSHPVFVTLSLKELLNTKIITWLNKYNLGTSTVEKSLEICAKLPAIYQKFSALEEQYIKLTSKEQEPSSAFSAKDLEHMQVLAKDIEFMEELAAIAGPLLNPSFSITNLKTEIKEHEQKLKDSKIPLGWEGHKPDLQKLLITLAKIKAHQALIETMTHAEEHCQHNFDEVLGQYFKIADGFVRDDKSIIPELESCLMALRSPDITPKETVDFAQKNWFDRLKESTEAELRETPQESLPHIDFARQAIGHAIAFLNQITMRVSAAKAKHQSISFLLNEAKNKLIDEGKALNEEWLHIAQSFGINPHLELTSLISIFTNFSNSQETLFNLKEKRHKLSDALTRLEEAERKLLAFRQSRQSQKEVPLSNPVILLNEIRATLRYLEPKRKKLALLGQAAASMKARGKIKELIREERRECAKMWELAFEEVCLNLLPITHDKAAILAAEAQELFALSLAAQAICVEKSDQLLDATGVVEILQIKDNVNVDPLIETLKARNKNTLTVVIATDANLLEKVRKAGGAYADQILLQPNLSSLAPATTTEKPTLVVKPEKKVKPKSIQTEKHSLLDQKAREALQILTNRR